MKCTPEICDDALCSYFRCHTDAHKSGKAKSIDASNPLTKMHLNAVPVYDKFNTYIQASSTSKIHKLFHESECLLKIVFLS